ncbi:serine protease inhibitor family protein [Haloferax elongans ATCC BAA-1513]|uniref:Serine protease inhibitor family protein n=1 Tax=Haloferax elongans ATCC BAA-1513 TaxID=1230453 RepID=M0HFV1_HALEO|nr:serpin family protein [Haloferax elongans]ELZ82668.1 serine protease inhibitor family protein [Haloferax elongans ATCC BAA-1513]
MNRRELLALSGALAAATLSGCTGSGQADPTTQTDADTTTTPPTEMTMTPADEPPAGEPSVDDERLAALASGNAEFALDLHAHLASQDDGNQFLSPYSISVALAMTYAGARGETRKQMEEVLHYTLGEDIHPAFSDLQSALEKRETATGPGSEEELDAFQLAVANALWGQEAYSFSEDFLASLEEHYGAGLQRADFANNPDDERKRINDWVADQTEDRIENLLPAGSITPDTALVLTNAIYFMANWEHKFDPKKTQDGTFTALDGSESTVPMMQQDLRTNYASLPGAEAVELPYVGGDVSMVLILPDEGTFEEFERNLDASQLFGIFDELSDAEGTLVFPKFEFKTKVQLKKALSDLGMPVAFERAANFSGMSADGQQNLKIDDVHHEAFVSVDEEGTEAAGATAAVIGFTSLPPSWGELRFDRPFLFAIRDRLTDAVLFLGRVVDAGAAQGSE